MNTPSNPGRPGQPYNPQQQQPQGYGQPQYQQPYGQQPGYGVTPDAQAMMQYNANKKETLIAYLLWFFLGSFGAHRFYLKRTGSAVGQLLLWLLGVIVMVVGGIIATPGTQSAQQTGGIVAIVGIVMLIGFSIWWIVDAFLIPGIVNRHNGAVAARLSMPGYRPQ